MTGIVQNGAPMTYFLGTDDQSGTTPVVIPEAIPTHLPKAYTYAQRGLTTPQLVVGASMTAMYGADSFDVRKKWATHQTELINTFNKNANQVMLQRLKPLDAPPPSNVRVYVDVLSTQVPEYKRNSDGSFELDDNGQKQPTGNLIQGYSVKFVAKHIDLDTNGVSTFGLGTIVNGDQVDASGNQSKRHPLFDAEASSFGSWGDNAGIRLFAPTAKSNIPVNPNLISNEKAYPIRMVVLERPDSMSSPVVQPTLDASQYVDLTFKEDVIDRKTDAEYYIGTQFMKRYVDMMPDDGSAPVIGTVGRIHVYQDEINALVKAFYDAELPYMDAFSDFTGEADEEHRFNFIGGVSSQNVAYHSYQLVSAGSDTVRFSENSTVYLSGGGDGTMNEDLFAKLVSTEVKEYGNKLSPLQNIAYYPESWLYDTGFPLDTKYDLLNFIALRKNTVVVLAAYDAGGVPLTASEESAMALALKTRAEMYPESDYYGTGSMRFLIVGRSGTLVGSKYKKSLPLSIDVADKFSAYMGASNRVWKTSARPDEYPNNVVSRFKEVNVTFTPSEVRNKDWANGMIWVENYGRRSLYYPALRSGFGDETSVMASAINVGIVAELESVGDRARRKFSGNSNLTPEQLIKNVNQAILDDCAGVFDSRVTVVPETYITAGDAQRGYSWTTKIKAYMKNMPTVMTLTIESRRATDLAATAG